MSELGRAYRLEAQSEWPNVTVIVYGDGQADTFTRTLRSLATQVHGEWEAICLDAPADVTKIDPRVRVISRGDLASELASYAADELFTFIEAGDTIAPTALIHLANAARSAGEFALIYSDEDRIEPRFGVRAVPHMKGAWSPDLALVQDYIGRLALVRRKNVQATGSLGAAAMYGIVLRAALCGDGPVIHLPFVLYHRAAENLQPDAALAAVVQGVLAEGPAPLQGGTVHRTEDHRLRIDWPLPDPPPRVSLIVPTRDRLDLLRVSIDGFLHETSYANLEILIADNESEQEETRAYLSAISADPRVRVISCPGPFNFSAINNRATAESTGALIGLMNNDLKVMEPEWLRRMAAHAIRPDVGIVGAKLLHGDDTIQHAGVTLGIGVASHLYKSFPRSAEGRSGRLLHTQDVSAVTAACLLMRREVWEEVGGLDEEFPVAYNDVDLCLKVRAAGYRILWTADARLYHLESQSRGKDITPEKRERLDLDKARLADRWGDWLTCDPFHSPNLSDRHVDGRLAFPSRATPPWRAVAK